MNKFIIATFSTLFVLSASVAFGHNDNKKAEKEHEQHHDEHGHEAEVDNTRFGVGKAVEAVDPEQGFKLSEKASKSLGVSFQKIAGQGTWKIPKQAIVHLKQSEAVYRRYDGWISMVLVKVVGHEGDLVIIKSTDLETGDEIAVTGAKFLRMTDTDINAGTVDNCAH